MVSRQNITVIIIIVLVAVAAGAYATLPRQNGSSNSKSNGVNFAANGSGGNNGNGTITLISISNGSLVKQSKYLITPNPFTGLGNYTVQDGSNADRNPADGITVINGVLEGNYTVSQIEAPTGYQLDKIPKMIKLSTSNGRAGTATFNISQVSASNSESSSATSSLTTTEVKSIVYTAKFECGTIRGNEGPLRPGHYDTDIGIFNKQEFPIQITWLAATNDGKSMNSILRTLQPQSPTSIVCQDLIRSFGNQSFVEGFALIQVPIDSETLGALSGSGSTVIGRTAGGEINLLDVQVFYTANALDELPHSILVDKITFAIVNDSSGKIPQSMMKKTLDISVPSNMSQISDPEANVKQELAKQYELTDQQNTALQIEIKNVDVGVGTMIDDHAVSLSRLTPQTSS
jgi:hypothetical protein